MKPSGCPSADELHALLQGTLSDGDVERVAAHLDVCSRCDETIATYGSTNDEILSALRQNATPLLTDEEPYRQTLDWAKAIGRSWIIAASADGQPPPALDDQLRGTILGDYRVERLLRRGGMGAVYQASHRYLERPIALKVLPAPQNHGVSGTSRFLREMATTGQVDHINIVRATDAGIADGRMFLAMELLEGADGRRLLKDHGPLPTADAAEITRQAALGLQHVHELGRVHRDVKPSNVFVTRDGVVKVLDLGLASLVDGVDGEELTGSGQMVGTIEYMAPEQALDPRAAGPRADVYALGATLYAFLVGHAPFDHPPNDTRGKRFLALLRERPQSVAVLRAGIPAEMLAIVNKAMQYKPEDRFASAGEFAAALTPLTTGSNLDCLVTDSLGNNKETTAQRLHSSTASVTGQRASKLGHESASAVTSRIGGWRWLMLVIGVAILAFAGAVIVRTPKGTIVIESDDPSIEVVVSQDGEDVAIINARNDWSVNVNEGSYEITLRDSRDSCMLTSDSVTVRQGQQTVLKATRLSGDDSDEPPALPDRWFRLVNAHSGLCLGTHDVPAKSGTSLRQRAIRPGDACQQWKFEATDTPSEFLLVHRSTGLCAALKQPKRGEGFLLRPAAADDAELQFTVTDLRDGHVKITSQSTGLTMAVWGKNTHEGEWIIQWPFKEQNADHRWSISPISDEEVGDYPADFPANPVVYLSFERETIYEQTGKRFVQDLSGNGLHAELSGLHEPVDGPAGQGLAFDGRGYATIPDHPRLRGGNDLALTIAYWFDPETGAAIRKFASPNRKDWSLAASKDKLKFYGEENNSDVIVGTNIVVPRAGWSHAAVIVDASKGTIQFFLNGQSLEETLLPPKASEGTDAAVRIGLHQVWPNEFRPAEPCRIDELVIFDRVLSNEELRTLYTYGDASAVSPR